MPKRKDYPKWFSNYSPPYKPGEPLYPKEERENNVFIKYISLEEYDSFSKESFLSNFDIDFDKVEVLHTYNNSAELHLFKKKLVKNNSYKQEIKQYEKDIVYYKAKLEAYEKQLKEWNILKEKWDSEEKEEGLKREKKLFKELQKKYGEENGTK